MKKKKFFGGYKRIVAPFAAVMMAVSMIGDAVPAMTARATSLLPSIDLTDEFPTPGDQGSQGSCVAWAVAYALKSHQEYLEHGWEFNEKTTFSPAYVYNQLNGGDKNSALGLYSVFNLIVDQGVCSMYNMKYNEDDWTTDPNQSQKDVAANFKADDWGWVNGISEMKERLANHEGVVVLLTVYSDFDNLTESNDTYDTVKPDECNSGGHAVCLIGYDDSKQRFKFINSWGTDWGIDGYGYISYDLLDQVNANSSTSYYGGYGAVLTDQSHKDTEYFYNENPKKVITNVEQRVYTSNIFFDSKNNTDYYSRTIEAGKILEIQEFIDATDGCPPCFLTTEMYVIPARKDLLTPVYTFSVVNTTGGTVTGSVDGDYNYNDMVKVTAKPKTAYKFKGWSKTEGGKIIKTTATYSFQITEDTTLYPNYEKLPAYTIKFDSNGGSGGPSSQKVYRGKKITLTNSKPTKSGFSFVGWSKQKQGIISIANPVEGTVYKSNKSYAWYNNVTLYALWEPKGGNGDVNGDKALDIADVSMVRAYIVGSIVLEGDQLVAADVNGDGDISILDVTILRQMIVAE